MVRFIFTLFFVSISLSASAGPNYKKVLKKWTRSHHIYSPQNFNASLLWHATLLNTEMKQSQKNRTHQAYDVDGHSVHSADLMIPGLDASHTVFFVSFYSQERRFDDFLDSQKTWSLNLEWCGNFYQPKIEKLAKNPSPLVRLLYPYLDVWSKTYLVSFDIPPSSCTKELTLHLSGPVARSELTWK